MDFIMLSLILLAAGIVALIWVKYSASDKSHQ
jgi:hypothetical protein